MGFRGVLLLLPHHGQTYETDEVENHSKIRATALIFELFVDIYMAKCRRNVLKKITKQSKQNICVCVCVLMEFVYLSIYFQLHTIGHNARLSEQ